MENELIYKFLRKLMNIKKKKKKKKKDWNYYWFIIAWPFTYNKQYKENSYKKMKWYLMYG